ncbi:hypothetical protein EMIT0194MI4_10725 [Pseudomonas sp. IT-194MI4]
MPWLASPIITTRASAKRSNISPKAGEFSSGRGSAYWRKSGTMEASSMWVCVPYSWFSMFWEGVFMNVIPIRVDCPTCDAAWHHVDCQGRARTGLFSIHSTSRACTASSIIPTPECSRAFEFYQ